jgi:hypothetical protein
MDQEGQNHNDETTVSFTNAPSIGVADPPPAATAVRAVEPVAVAPDPAPVYRRSRGARLLNVALAGAVALAIAGVAFAAGRLTAPTSVTAGNLGTGGPGGFFRNGNGQGGQNGQSNGRGGPFAGGLTIEGTVESVTASTLTLKTDSGQTIQIALDGSTTYHAQTDASASDVTAGGKVLVRLNLRGGDGGGPSASGEGSGTNGDGALSNPSASDVTVVP